MYSENRKMNLEINKENIGSATLLNIEPIETNKSIVTILVESDIDVEKLKEIKQGSYIDLVANDEVHAFVFSKLIDFSEGILHFYSSGYSHYESL